MLRAFYSMHSVVKSTDTISTRFPPPVSQVQANSARRDIVPKRCNQHKSKSSQHSWQSIARYFQPELSNMHIPHHHGIGKEESGRKKNKTGVRVTSEVFNFEFFFIFSFFSFHKRIKSYDDLE